MRATSSTSSRCTQTGPPSPTWAPLGLGALQPSTPAPLPSHCCSSCSYAPPSAGGKEEHRDTQTQTCALTHILRTCQQSQADCCKIRRNVVKKRTSPFVSSIPSVLHRPCFFLYFLLWRWHFGHHGLTAATVVDLCAGGDLAVARWSRASMM